MSEALAVALTVIGSISTALLVIVCTVLFLLVYFLRRKVALLERALLNHGHAVMDEMFGENGSMQVNDVLRFVLKHLGAVYDKEKKVLEIPKKRR